MHVKSAAILFLFIQSAAVSGVQKISKFTRAYGRQLLDLAVNDNGSFSVFAISLNDCNHLRRLKFALFDHGHVSTVIWTIVSV
jgi:hypothetical protein